MTFMNPEFTGHEKKFLIASLLAGLAIIVFFVEINKNLKPTETTIIINGHKIMVELARTPDEQYQGLSNRDKLCTNCGMLFIFPQAAIQTFVMRNMRFPLDIVFINNDRVIKISPNLLPEGANPQTLYSSDVPVNYVLELNSGYTDQYNINVGDLFQHTDF